MIRNADRVHEIASKVDELLGHAPHLVNFSDSSGADVAASDVTSLLAELRRLNALALRQSSADRAFALPDGARPRAAESLLESAKKLKAKTSAVFSSKWDRGNRVVTRSFLAEAKRLASEIADELELIQAATAVVIQCDPLAGRVGEEDAVGPLRGTKANLCASGIALPREAISGVSLGDPWPFDLKLEDGQPIDSWPWADVPRFEGD
jgi:hypothetical protein